jgi:hypothetical protein
LSPGPGAYDPNLRNNGGIKFAGKGPVAKIPEGPGPGSYLCPDALFNATKS